jgi:hypothetical protein
MIRFLLAAGSYQWRNRSTGGVRLSPSDGQKAKIFVQVVLLVVQGLWLSEDCLLHRHRVLQGISEEPFTVCGLGPVPTVYRCRLCGKETRPCPR